MVNARRSDSRVNTLACELLGPRVEKVIWASLGSPVPLSPLFCCFPVGSIFLQQSSSSSSSVRHSHRRHGIRTQYRRCWLVSLHWLVIGLAESRSLVGLGWFFCLVYQLQTASVCHRPHHLPSFLCAGLHIHRLSPSGCASIHHHHCLIFSIYKVVVVMCCSCCIVGRRRPSSQQWWSCIA
jgi:hypothetical protein